MYYRFDSPQIPQADLEMTYNYCLHPIVTHWPPNHDSGGHFHLGSFDIPAHLLQDFVHMYLDAITQLCPYFQDAFFGHELHGWKATTVHNLDEDGSNDDENNPPYEHVNALQDLTCVLHMPLINPEQWLVDVGLKFSSHGQIIRWQKNGHVVLICYLFPDLDSPAAVLQCSQKYYVDYHMHLKDIAGFCWMPGRNSDILKYVQAYTTEKAISYQLHDGIFCPHKPSELLTDQLLKCLLDDLDQQGMFIFTCTGNGDTWDYQLQSGCAHVEVRVPLNHATNVLTRIPQHLINNTMAQISAPHWW
ncbi:hypothetical protein EDC04DRAFT_2870718 [Pisolithus marmoratus]|nr:hypothetical protein EDC04DRAFT_2870718 [Pisolithus marmoratus]